MGGALGLLGVITGAPIDCAIAFYGRPEGGDVRDTSTALAANHPLLSADACLDAAIQDQGAHPGPLWHRGRIQGLCRPACAPWSCWNMLSASWGSLACCQYAPRPQPQHCRGEAGSMASSGTHRHGALQTMKEFFDGVKSPGTAELFVYEVATAALTS